MGSQPTSKVNLPPSYLGDDRNFEMKYTHHGDVRLLFWCGDIEYDRNHPPSSLRMFAMSHGSEVRILASMAGFYRRLEVPEPETRQTFLHAARLLIDEYSHRNEDDHYRTSSIRYAQTTAKGLELPVYDEDKRDWRALEAHIPTQPGVVEEVGGVGIYTRTDIFNQQTMLLAHILSDFEQKYHPDVVAQTVELTKTDIPPVAEVICNLSMGEYRNNIHEFVQAEFINREDPTSFGDDMDY